MDKYDNSISDVENKLEPILEWRVDLGMKKPKKNRKQPTPKKTE